MKEFMFFIRKKDNSEKTLSSERMAQFLKACEVYIENLKSKGALISAKPIDWHGKIISGRGDKWKESEYDEPGEVIGGYYHILAKDFAEAVEIAKKNPEFTYNENTRIEVRPVKTREIQTGFAYPSETSGKLEVKAAIQIQKPVKEVFEAIIDPEKMSNYFISKGSSVMEAGKQIDWKFPEFDMTFPIKVDKIEKNKYVSYYWEMDGFDLLVEMNLSSRPDGSTLVTITEKSRPNDEAGIKWLKGNTEGWANFLACLKAWLEYGIHLRKGAFDFMGDKKS